MRAIVYTEYGSPEVLHLTELARPAPAPNEVLIKICAASANPLDWRLMRGKPAIARPFLGGWRRPGTTCPGVDVSGRIEAVGNNVKHFKPGDDVLGVCKGAFAEYVCTPEDKVVLKPANRSYAEAAAVPVAAISALQGLRDYGRIQRGHKVAIDGASGGVGTYAIQIAAWFGAEVTAVCSTAKMDRARSLGAHHVIDYTREDFTRSGQRYDLILAANAHRSIFDYRRALGPNGIHVLVGGGWSEMGQTLTLAPVLSRLGRKKMHIFFARIKQPDLIILRDWLEDGTIASIIDRQYPLHEAADALRYLEAGHAAGKVIITVNHDGE